MQYFSRASVAVNLSDQKVVSWQMQTISGLAESLDFYVDRARSGGEWQQVAGPLTDICFYVDDVRTDWNKDRNVFYRVRFKKGGAWQYSAPAQALGNWSRQDFAKAREICRKEYLLARYAGEVGVLLKRKEWGAACSCIDPDTREVSNTLCPLCLGTGIQGGYYAPIPLRVLADPSSKSRSMSEEAGLVQPETREVRVVAYPLVLSQDIWCNSSSNERWQFREVVAVAEIRSQPLVQKLSMRMIPQTDVVYRGPGIEKTAEKPLPQPSGAGNEYGWSTPQTDCINDFLY